MTVHFKNTNAESVPAPACIGENHDLITKFINEDYQDFPCDAILESFSLPTVITDENLVRISQNNPDSDFSEILFYRDKFLCFKERKVRDRFFEFNKKLYGLENRKAVIRDIFPICDGGKFSKVIRLKNIISRYDANIISISVLCFEKIRDFQPIVFRNIFGFTPAESRLATLLLNGNSVNEAADQLGVRTCTVREQLSSLFAKTGTSRQPELVSMLSRLELITG